MALSNPQTGPRAPRTVVEGLGGVIAGVRAAVHAPIGDRPYRVFLCVRTWEGGERGRPPVTITRTELGCDKTSKPMVPPRFKPPEGAFRFGPQGVTEDGRAVIDELDPRYTEAELNPIGRLDGKTDVFFEVVMDARGGGAPDLPVRRFEIDGAPEYRATGEQWRLLVRAVEPSAPFGNDQESADGGTAP